MSDFTQPVEAADQKILREPVIPWALGVVFAVAIGLLAYYLLSIKFLSEQQAASTICFCTFIAVCFLPRSIPGRGHLKIDADGVDLRHMFASTQIAWHDVIGPFVIEKTWLGDGVSFTHRNRKLGNKPFSRVFVRNVYAIKTYDLVAELNKLRRHFLRMDEIV